jgi:hypothetical protein
MMPQQGPDLEQRFSKLEEQLDRFSLALQQWQQTQTRLIDWNAIETRLEPAVNQRIREFEQTMQRELSALRQLHEQPVKQLREQAASLAEICVVAASSSVSGLERTESRFTALEADLHLRLNDLANGLQAVVAELRGGAGAHTASVTGSAEAWPLEDVVRLHDDLRRSASPPEKGAASKPPPQLSEAAAAFAGRVESLEQAVTVGRDEVSKAADRIDRQRRSLYVAFAVLALGVIGAGALGLGLQRRVDTKLNEAAARVTAAERQAEGAAQLANQRVAAAREDADRKIVEAEQIARKAQIVSDILAAPDLVRFNVTSGATTPRTYAQLLWSRSRGLVFSGSRVPAAPVGITYQAWLLTSEEPVSAGLFVPDTAGRVMLVTEDPPRVPRTVTGVAVTLEPTGGRATPSGPTLLAREP